MADEYIAKDYDGGAQATTLTSGFTVGGATLTVSNGSTFPDGSGGPFVVVVDRGLASEEKFLIDTTTGANGVTFNIQQAGYDGTTAVNHNSGATVEHCLDAYTLKQANRYVNLQTTKGDLVVHTASTTDRLAVGTTGVPLVANSAASAGVNWAQLGTAGIADNAVTLAKLATAVQNLLIPAGTVAATIKSSADTGWLLLDGSAIATADSLYPSLWAVAPSSWKAGTTLNLPNMANKMLEGAGTTTLGASGGSNTVTIGSGNLPTHTHAIDHDHGSASISASDSGHTHGPGGGTSVFVVQTSGAGYNVAVESGSTYNATNVSTTATGYASISGSVDLPNFTGSSGNGGFANSALTVTNAHIAVNYQIKAH